MRMQRFSGGGMESSAFVVGQFQYLVRVLQAPEIGVPVCYVKQNGGLLPMTANECVRKSRSRCWIADASERSDLSRESQGCILVLAINRLAPKQKVLECS
jgi:hypothetical protein